MKHGHVGILADTTALAASLATEFHIRRPLLLSPANIENALSHEKNLTVVMVDESQWPLDTRTAWHVIAALAINLGHIIRLERIDVPEIPCPSDPLHSFEWCEGACQDATA